ncbi:2-oxo acid dehydrogenase subunit E2 [Micrococcus sp.]|uniref:2-oxo acid dehydrogenase subunit E2 n=1 Tax=Micrococcus sp. TaxID=1271 RepID=UPI002A917097|nr:2-oxo acid dehydrogenase subunit E2 [Micrococcus sp.]MDY6054612.1 2-oxo acid dehydrogenase subunit E2 [Micrococcus sp.]
MAEIFAVEMPKWGMTMEEGTITSWLVSEGDEVSEGDALAEAESSKISGEVEAPQDGVVARIVVDAGSTVEIGTMLAVMTAPGVSAEEVDAFINGGAAAEAPAEDESAASDEEDAPAAAPAPAASSGPVRTEGIHRVEMPKWGMTMEEGTITSWLVSEGDEVSEGDALAEAESSKISGEVEAPQDGVVARIVVEPGSTVDIGTTLAVITDPDVPAEDVDAYLASEAAGGSSETHDHDDPQSAAAASKLVDDVPDEKKQFAPAKDKSTPSTRKSIKGSTHQPGATSDARSVAKAAPDRIPDSLKGKDENEVPATPHAADLAAKHGIALSKVEATGRGGRVTVADLQKAVEKAGGSLGFGNDRPRQEFTPSQGDDSLVDATEHARSLAEEEGVNLLDVRPSGRKGRVTLDDVRAWIALNREPEAPEAPAPTAAASSAPAAGEENRTTRIPMSNMRKVIGARLQESYLDSPHFRVSVEAKLDNLLAFRKQVNDNRLDVRLTVNDLVTTAVAKALKKVPALNAQFDAESQTITQFEHADISIAVSTDEGLITPIVKAADTLSPSEISAQITDLAVRAKAGTLKPEQFQGGTFTISNLGMFGIAHFDAIINPPQVAILAVGGAKKQFVPDANGNPVAATILTATLSADHRVVDGATSAMFCKELKTLLETPALLFA